MDRRQRVLVVDDEPLVLKTLLRTLARSTWDPIGASDGREAISFLATQDFDAVLSDLILGPGATAIDILRQMPDRNRGKRFVILTGHATLAWCREAFLVGAADFIEKPVRAAQLLASLASSSGSGNSETPSEIADIGITVESSGGRHVQSVLRQMERRFVEVGLTTADLASAEGISVEHLCRLFQDHLGRSPLEHLHSMRLEEAKRQLTRTELSVYEIARCCGYGTTSQFDRHFLRHAGCTPKRYRLKGH